MQGLASVSQLCAALGSHIGTRTRRGLGVSADPWLLVDCDGCGGLLRITAALLCICVMLRLCPMFHGMLMKCMPVAFAQWLAAVGLELVLTGQRTAHLQVWLLHTAWMFPASFCTCSRQLSANTGTYCFAVTRLTRLSNSRGPSNPCKRAGAVELYLP